MKKLISLFACIALTATFASAQKSSTDLNFELGNGLNINMNNGQHKIKIGGYVQTEAVYNEVKDMDADMKFGVRKAYFNVGGSFMEEKMSFLLQLDYTDAYPLLDAWIAYSPISALKFSVGQKQSFSGTRSMMFHDYSLALGGRSLSDKTFFASGREFGLFAESRLPIGSAGADLGIAVTSGDGRNSFGANSTDYDFGGLKYSARASVYPLGFFSDGNDLTDTDFAREATPKIALGGAFSYNVGASDRIGEGHGTFKMYDDKGVAKYPDYQKISADVMIKYSGLTLLAEYTNAIGANLNGLYTQAVTTSYLQPHQIADYLAIGNGITVQAGYLFKSNWAVDLRYSEVTPEWSDKQTQVAKSTSIGGGVAKYFIDNRLKVQLTGEYRDFPELTINNKVFTAERTAHVVF